MKPNDIRFLQLLQRWLSGDLRRREEADLHELAASDDFQREALEGFLQTASDDHAARLAALRARLNARTGGTRQQPMWPRLLALAAALVLVVVAVRFLPEWTGRETGPVAMQQEPPKQEDTPASAGSTPETAAAERTPARMPSPPPVAAMKPAQRSIYKPESAPAGDTVGIAQIQELPAEELGYEDAPSVAPYSMQKSAMPPPLAEAAPARTLQADIPVSGAQPAGSWEELNRFLLQNARLTTEARNQNVSGFVRLEFGVDSSGTPTRILVLQSLGFGCDEKAVRLLLQTRWLAAGAGRDTIDIWFRR